MFFFLRSSQDASTFSNSQVPNARHEIELYLGPSRGYSLNQVPILPGIFTMHEAIRILGEEAVDVMLTWEWGRCDGGRC